MRNNILLGITFRAKIRSYILKLEHYFMTNVNEKFLTTKLTNFDKFGSSWFCFFSSGAIKIFITCTSEAGWKLA